MGIFIVVLAETISETTTLSGMTQWTEISLNYSNRSQNSVYLNKKRHADFMLIHVHSFIYSAVYSLPVAYHFNIDP